MAIYSGSPQSVFVLISLLVCLIPTTIGGLLSAIGIAGMDRVYSVTCSRCRAARWKLQATWTLCFSTKPARSRSAIARNRIRPRPGVIGNRISPTQLSFPLSDETPEGRSIVVLAKEKYGLRGRELSAYAATFIPFSAVTRMSGVDLEAVISVRALSMPSPNTARMRPQSSPREWRRQ